MSKNTELYKELLGSMGFLSAADREKALFALTHPREAAQAEWARQRRNKELSHEALSALTDSDLYEAVWNRTNERVEQAETDRAGVAALPRAAQVFYVIYMYELEVNNGGLCQYFANSSRETAPLLSDCLAEINALDHKALFDGFVRENGIDLEDLSSFVSDSVEAYQSQTLRYPFESFDDAFFELPALATYLLPYIRVHLADF